MNQPITNTISTFIDSQLPGFIRDDNPQFAAFIKAYYAWMEQSDIGAVVAKSKELPTYKDIDLTLDAFIQYFTNDFLPYFPNETALDKRKLIKVAKEFYSRKGSIESIQFLFKVLYNLEADVFLPKENILKASDGKWNLPQALRLIETDTPYPTVDGGEAFNSTQLGTEVDAGDFTDTTTLLLNGADFTGDGILPKTFNVALLVGKKGVGSVSNAVCVIESADRVVDVGIGLEIIQVFVTGITKPFSDLENLLVVYGQDDDGSDLIFNEKIVASLSDIKVNPKSRGLKYRGTIRDVAGVLTYPGDPVVITGGLPVGDAKAQKAVAFVNTATTGSITGAKADFGGYGYRVQPNTIVTVLRGSGDTTGTGGNVIVQSIDSDNSVFLLIDIDSAGYKDNVRIDAVDYGFANMIFANDSTVISDALTYQNIQFAAITSMNVINGGGGYSTTPTLNMAVTFYSDLDNDLSLAGDPALANNLSYIDDLGVVCAVSIDSNGSGYSNVTDRIVVPSAIGYNAVFDFVTAPTSNAITSVIITALGEGYIELPIQLAIVNSANIANASAGVGGVLTAWGFGQGARTNVAVNKIGEIIDFRLVSRGFDYIDTPTVSMRIQDLVMVDMGSNLSFVVDETIYQGVDINTTSYVANVDSYNVASKTLRVYDYRGALSPNSNLSTTTQNVRINVSAANSVLTYGDGKAKANAIFLNGLINFPGFFYNTDGFLSSDKYIQGANVYHNYSYVISVEKSLKNYKETLINLVHPAGMKMLGRYIVKSDDNEKANVTSQVAVEPAISGRVYCNAFDVNRVLIGSGGGNTTTNTFYAHANLGQTFFDIPQGDISDAIQNEINVLVMRNGLIEVPVTHYTTTSNSLTFTNPCRADDIVEVRIFGGSPNNLVITSDSYFSGVNQTSFAMATLNANSSNEFNSRPYVIATKNGLVQVPTFHYDIIGSNVVFTQNCRFGDVVEFRQFTGNVGPLGNVLISTIHNPIVANAGNTVFVLPSNVDSESSAIISINGLIQVPQLQYTITSNNILTLSQGVRLNDFYDFRLFLGDVGGGNGTNFLQTTNVGDLVSFGYSDGTRPLFTKVVTRVVSNTVLIMESNTQFPLEGFISTTAGQNTILSSSNVYGNIANNDVVLLNLAGNIISSLIVQPPTSNIIYVNTVFSQNSSNQVVLIYPSINAATYRITNMPT